jgi:hypothetical protein
MSENDNALFFINEVCVPKDDSVASAKETRELGILLGCVVRSFTDRGDAWTKERIIAAAIACFVTVTLTLFNIAIPVQLNRKFLTPLTHVCTKGAPVILIHKSGYIGLHIVDKKGKRQTFTFTDVFDLIVACIDELSIVEDEELRRAYKSIWAGEAATLRFVPKELVDLHRIFTTNFSVKEIN